MEWPMLTIKDELPTNPQPGLPDEVYQAFAGLTIPVVAPLGDYGWWCFFVPIDDMITAEGVMSSGDVVKLVLERERPEAAKWFRKNSPNMIKSRCEDGRPFMLVFPYDIEVPGRGVIADEKAIHTRDRMRWTEHDGT
jgi:hypothetical protein